IRQANRRYGQMNRDIQRIANENELDPDALRRNMVYAAESPLRIDPTAGVESVGLHYYQDLEDFRRVAPPDARDNIENLFGFMRPGVDDQNRPTRQAFVNPLVRSPRESD